MTRLRSVLFTPGGNERALQKAGELPADALILDLEDAVAPVAKAQARENVCAALADPGRLGARRTVAVRINAISTEWHEQDIAAVARAAPAAVVVPKVMSPADVAAVARSLDQAGAPDSIRIWVMLETPLAVLNAAQIAAASDRLSTIVVGTNDLAKELHAQPSADRAPLMTSLSLCILAARAHGRAVLDGVFNDISDLDGFEAECRQGRVLGFDGKTLIHPSQVEPCNRAYSPGERELEHARRVIAAFDQAAGSGAGVARLDGEMIEQLHVDQALALLAAHDS